MHLPSKPNISKLFARFLTGSILAIGALGVFFFTPPLFQSGLILIILAYVLIVEWPSFNQASLTIFYPVLPALCWSLLPWFPQEFAMMTVAVASQDTGGYIGGLFWGKHLLAPTISPRKTWEGLMCGIVCAILSVCILFASEANLLYLSLFAVICAFLGVIGDLFESYLKRVAHLKDAGNLLPGHGGVLDRIDGYLGASPAVLLFIFVRLWIF